MIYPEPTVEQTWIIAVAAIVPLVWAFTHHGNTRKTTLMLWLPWVLFVARATYMNSRPTAPLEWRLKTAAITALMDPMTIAWPVFVLLTFGLIRLFTAPRRRREANALKDMHAGCPRCGAAAVPGAPYCPQCGYGLAPRPETNTRPEKV